MRLFSSGARLPLKSLVLLCGLVTVLILTPLAVEAGGVGLFWRMLYLVIFCIGGYLLLEHRKWTLSYIALAIPTLFLGVIKESSSMPGVIDVISAILTATLQLLLILAVFRFALYDSTASKLDCVVAGICGYIILGIFWADICGTVSQYVPDGFWLPDGSLGQLPQNDTSLYYSFVTMTTLGYGDISPAQPWTRMLAIMQSLTGTLYLAVFISSLVNSKR
ncbi:MAG: ion channel [Verrucomicrobiota bacterium]